MALVSLRQLLDHAAENGYGVPAFNINNMEQMLAIMNAADKTDSPVIMQASRGARKYANDTVLSALIKAAMDIYPHIPICMHQDHGNDANTCLSAITNGFSSVMMDGSLQEDAKTPSSYDYNVEVTGKVSDLAHMVGVSVEGELGCLGSLETGEGDKEDGHGFEGKLDKSMLLTDPDEAADFVGKTKVDALAVAIGTSHGAYKFTRKPTGDILAMEVIKKINEAGGDMPQTYGVPVEEIAKGIKTGVRKVNIDTDNRLAMTGQIRKVLMDKKAEFDPRAYLKPAMAAMQKLCEDRYELFGTAGNASKINVIPLPEMAERYQSGSLDPSIK